MKKYDSILRYGKRGTKEALTNKEVTIMEKLDGANASFGIIDGKLRAFSRNQELSDTNTLRGFYGFVQSRIDTSVLIPDLIYFGEWLVPHTVQYKSHYLNKFYLFDIFDPSKGTFLPSGSVTTCAALLNINTPEVFYQGVLNDPTEAEQYIGRSSMTEVPNTGEGIVIKTYGEEHFFVKMVSDKFKEFKPTKLPSANKNDIDSLIDSVLTPHRIEKLIHKKIDLGLLPTEMDITDTGKVLKTLGSDVVNDIFEEELHLFLDNLRKKIAKKTPLVVKGLLDGGFGGER